MQLISGASTQSDANLKEIFLRVERLTIAKRLWRGMAEDGMEFGFELAGRGSCAARRWRVAWRERVTPRRLEHQVCRGGQHPPAADPPATAGYPRRILSAAGLRPAQAVSLPPSRQVPRRHTRRLKISRQGSGDAAGAALRAVRNGRGCAFVGAQTCCALPSTTAQRAQQACAPTKSVSTPSRLCVSSIIRAGESACLTLLRREA